MNLKVVGGSDAWRKYQAKEAERIEEMLKASRQRANQAAQERGKQGQGD